MCAPSLRTLFNTYIYLFVFFATSLLDLCHTHGNNSSSTRQQASKVMILQHLAAPLVAALPALLLVQYTREEADKFSAELLTFVFVVTAACLFFIAAKEQGPESLHDFDDADSADEVALKKAVTPSNSPARRLWRRVFTRADWKHNVITCFENVSGAFCNQNLIICF
jgi:hypothetical protein